jgi:SAM-dependent methyltransferase
VIPCRPMRGSAELPALPRGMAFRDALYEQYASTFKGPRDPPSRAWWEHKYLPLLGDLPRDAPVLEIGCGTGELLAFLQARGFTNAHGIDISPEQVVLARARGVDAEVGDALQISGSYGLIIAVDVLEHFTRDELLRLARVLYEALQPGGRLLIQTANGAGLFPRQVIYGDLTHMTIFTPESLAQLLKSSGFADLSFYETGPVPLRLRGKLNVLAWQLIKGAANIVRGIETGKSQAIWTENFICVARKPG